MKSKSTRVAVFGSVLAAALALGIGTGSATGSGSAREAIRPDGSCELVDARGVPLYDSQLSQRTGSDSCAER